jgi:sugar O-acyltransferase (sialic acid O-acetyltransferase NeuD family)
VPKPASAGHPIAIRGAGGFAKEVAVLLEQINAQAPEPLWRILGFIDADDRRKGQMHGKYPILGGDDYLREQSEPLAVALAIGTPEPNAAVAADLLTLPQLSFPTLVHPSAIFDAPTVELGRGVIVSAGCLLTTDIVIGDFTILNLGVTVGHDCRIGAHCVLNPHVDVAGGTVIGDRCLLGSGAVVLQLRTIGAGATVGAGAVVTTDVAPSVTVAGVPARPL